MRTIVRALVLITLSFLAWFALNLVVAGINWVADNSPWWVGMIGFIAFVYGTISLINNTFLKEEN